MSKTPSMMAAKKGIIATRCDACKRIKVKCAWEGSRVFAPTCERCQRYGLLCVVNSVPWTVACLKESVAAFPTAPSRRFFWGPSSNAGGHPLDLHRKSPPPSPPAAPRSSGPACSPANGPKRGVIVSEDVREHLYTLFFEQIQPVWPVVTRMSLARHPPSPLLDAAILGAAARHHRAIASMRDFAHIQDVLTGELRDLFSLRKPYKPDIQTLQALLIILLCLELGTKAHSDLLKVALRTSAARQIARDLSVHAAWHDPDLEDSDNDLQQMLSAACVFQDSCVSAMLGQTMNISSHEIRDFAPVLYGRSFIIENGTYSLEPRAYFYHAACLSRCLGFVLSCFFGNNPSRGSDLHSEASSILSQIQWHQVQIDCLRKMCDVETYHALQMIQNNNRLLFNMGLRRVIAEHDEPLVSLRAMLIQQSGSLIHEACETMEMCTTDILRSPPGQQSVILYAYSRASMVVIDAVRDSRRGAVFSAGLGLGQRLLDAVAKARFLMVFLLQEPTWSLYWTQGYTIKAILARLDEEDATELAANSRAGSSVEPSEFTNNKEPGELDSLNGSATATDFVNSTFQSTDWDIFFALYDQEFDWDLDDGFL